MIMMTVMMMIIIIIVVINILCEEKYSLFVLQRMEADAVTTVEQTSAEVNLKVRNLHVIEW
jgi:hypothetical protein